MGGPRQRVFFINLKAVINRCRSKKIVQTAFSLYPKMVKILIKTGLQKTILIYKVQSCTIDFHYLEKCFTIKTLFENNYFLIFNGNLFEHKHIYIYIYMSYVCI